MSYFLSYLWRQPDSLHWQPGHAVTSNEHPLDWIARAWLTYGRKPGFDIVLTFFTEIPDDVYRRHDRS